jgi:hypothetical protein
MIERDLLVAAIAIGLGSMMLHTAIANEGWCFQMAFARMVAKRRGNESARYVIGSVGTFVILLGLYTFCSPFLNSQDFREAKTNGSGENGFQADSKVSLIAQ